MGSTVVRHGGLTVAVAVLLLVVACGSNGSYDDVAELQAQVDALEDEIEEATPSTTTSTTTTVAPTTTIPDRDIRAFDFQNVTLPAGSCWLAKSGWGTEGQVVIEGGLAAAGPPDAPTAGGIGVIGDPSYVDLDGDGSDEAILSVFCSTGGNVVYTFLLPLDVDREDLVLLGGSPITQAAAPDGGRPPGKILDFGLEGTDLVVREIYPVGEEPKCCFTGLATVRWSWSGDEWVATVDAQPRVDPGTTLSLKGIGPVVAGMTIAEADQAAGRWLEVEGFDDLDGQCYRASISGLDGLSFQIENPAGLAGDPKQGTIGRASVYEGPWRTISGIGIGSSAEEVHAAYGDQIVSSSHEYRDGVYLDFVPVDPADADYMLRFEVDRGRVVAMHAGYERAVSLVEGCL